MLKIENIIFDFDGVIKESVEIKTEAFKSIYDQYDSAILKKIVTHHDLNGGMSRYKKFKYYHENYLGINISEEEIEKLCNEFSNLVVEKIIDSPYVIGFLEFLKKSKNYSMFISTGTPQIEIERIIKELELNSFFKSVLGSPSSKEDHIEYLINNFKINVNKTIFIGDSINDKDAAINKDILFIR